MNVCIEELNYDNNEIQKEIHKEAILLPVKWK